MEFQLRVIILFQARTIDILLKQIAYHCGNAHAIICVGASTMMDTLWRACPQNLWACLVKVGKWEVKHNVWVLLLQHLGSCWTLCLSVWGRVGSLSLPCAISKLSCLVVRKFHSLFLFLSKPCMIFNTFKYYPMTRLQESNRNEKMEALSELLKGLI